MTPEENNRKLNKAIRFATDRHAGQLRKGSTTPYILHPLEVLTILASLQADTDLLIAGLLHDTVEDTNTTPKELLQEFGPEVTRLVCCHSEDKRRSWKERKLTAIRETRQADRRLKLLILADKLSNIRSMVRDHRSLGESFWNRFNAPREEQRWYYGQIIDALSPLAEDPPAAGAYQELVHCYQQLFPEA